MSTSNIALPIEPIQLPTPEVVQAGMTSDIADITAVRTLGEKFKKACATKTYGMGDSLKFRIVVPFKKLIGLATEADKENLELYQMHKELRSSIEKVKTAFKTYCGAEKEVTAASPDALKGARYHEKYRAHELIVSYQNLIGLATEQAEKVSNKRGSEMRVNSAFLRDTQKALKAATKDLGDVYYTVHALRARITIQGLGKKPENVQEKFMEAVTAFEQIEEDALSELGSTDDEDLENFRAAFIQGLASVPGLRETQVFSFESQLRISETREKYYEEMIDKFVAEMEIIVRGDKFAQDVLPALQYNGIYFPASDDLVNRLNQAQVVLKELRALEEKKQALALESQEAGEMIDLLKTTSKYTVAEFVDFVRSAADKIRLGAMINEGKGTFGEIGKLIDLENKIKKLEEKVAQEIVQGKLDIQARKDEIARIRTESEEKAREIQGIEQQIDQLGSNLEAFQREFAALNENFNKLSAISSSPEELASIEQMRDVGKSVLSTKEKTCKEKIESLQKQKQALEQGQIQRHDNIGKLSAELKDLEAVFTDYKGTAGVVDQLKALSDEKTKLEQTECQISADNLVEIAAGLRITPKEGKLGHALDAAQRAQSLEKDQVRRSNDYQEAEVKISQLQARLPAGVDYSEGNLSIDPDVFFTEEEFKVIYGELTRKLDTALQISEKVHEAVVEKRTLLILQAKNKNFSGLNGLEVEVLHGSTEEVLATSTPQKNTERLTITMEEDSLIAEEHPEAAELNTQIVEPIENVAAKKAEEKVLVINIDEVV